MLTFKHFWLRSTMMFSSFCKSIAHSQARQAQALVVFKALLINTSMTWMGQHICIAIPSTEHTEASASGCDLLCQTPQHRLSSALDGVPDLCGSSSWRACATPLPPAEQSRSWLKTLEYALHTRARSPAGLGPAPAQTTKAQTSWTAAQLELLRDNTS